ncbi:hypothetical protein ALC53_10439 [Atta colombica]|uniref:Uncharacterized protein n=1 Tax=Atta colombica TaxID=520822 RepID=A0A151I073_9HYME|nr:hypothetical protein ALC53_10439 [Atta colombica]
MLVCKSFALVMRVNFPAAVALWLHFSSSATVCAALTARSALLHSPPRERVSERASAPPERIDRDSADPTIARPGTRSPPTVHDFRLSLSDAVYE